MGGVEAAFFDLDKTVISKSSSLALSRPFYRAGLVTRSQLFRGAYAQLVYLALGADEKRMDRAKDVMLTMTKGWSRSEVEDVVRQALETVVDPYLYQEALDLISLHRALGRRVFIVSSAPEEVVRPLAERIGVEDVIALKILEPRRHVQGRADGHPLVGDGRRRGGPDRDGNAEIGYHGVTALEENVPGLDVAVHHAALVSVCQTLCHLRGDRQRARHRQRLAGQEQRAQLGALDVLHRHVALGLGLADVVDGDDVGMVEAARRARLLVEALFVHLRAVAVHRHVDGLDGDDALQHRVLRLVDDAHRAAADLGEDLEAAELFLFHGNRPAASGWTSARETPGPRSDVLPRRR